MSDFVWAVAVIVVSASIVAAADEHPVGLVGWVGVWVGAIFAARWMVEALWR